MLTRLWPLMRVLLDEQLPRHLAKEIGGHDISTVQQRGWAGLKNGEPLRCCRWRGLWSSGDRWSQSAISEKFKRAQNLLNLPFKSWTAPRRWRFERSEAVEHLERLERETAQVPKSTCHDSQGKPGPILRVE
jgi:hypothetical protein